MLSDDLIANFPIDRLESDFGPYLFLRAHAARRHGHLTKERVRAVVARDLLPERAQILHDFAKGDAFELLAEYDDAVVLLRRWSATTDIWVSAPSTAQVTAVATELRERLPEEDAEGRVDVTFTDSEIGNRYLKIGVRGWADVRHLYGATVQSAIDDLTSYRPADGEPRRLLLWRGPAGTGKTTAIRALLHAWEKWADGVIVSDPESLMSSGRYLSRIVLEEQDAERWQLVVLEDAESLLRKDAGSDAISRMLNLCDGLLGQGLRCMFLLTTNAPLGAINPAVIRPGRCLANIEFGPLSSAEAAAILGRPVSHPMTLAEVMTDQPVEADIESIAVGQYL